MRRHIVGLLVLAMMVALGGVPLAIANEDVIVVGGDEVQELKVDGAIKVQGDYIIDSPFALIFMTTRPFCLQGQSKMCIL